MHNTKFFFSVPRFSIRRKKNPHKLNVFFLDQNRRNFTPQKLPVIRYMYICPLTMCTMYYLVCKKSNTTGDTSGAGSAFPSETHVLYKVRVDQYLIFSVFFYRSLFVLLFFFFFPLYCLSIFDLRLLIVPLISSNISSK